MWKPLHVLDKASHQSKFAFVDQRGYLDTEVSGNAPTTQIKKATQAMNTDTQASIPMGWHHPRPRSTVDPP